jgi:hypothetical protein
MTSNIPEIILLCMDKIFLTAFNDALEKTWQDHDTAKLKITPINERLNSLPEGATFDLIVSPANSYARLDGAFDHAISTRRRVNVRGCWLEKHAASELLPTNVNN